VDADFAVMLVALARSGTGLVHPSFQGIDLLNIPADPIRSTYVVAQTPLAYQYGIVRSGHKLIYDERDASIRSITWFQIPVRKLTLPFRDWSCPKERWRCY
jgi:hypothetical protein